MDSVIHDCICAMTISISTSPHTHSGSLKLYVYIAFTVLCWGYSPIGVHSALHAYNPAQIALLRFLIASVFLLLLVMKQGIQPVKLKDIPALTILGIFSVTLHHLLINTGQQYVTATASSILSQSIPLFTVLISSVLLKERIAVKQWFCILLGLCGAVIVVTADRGFELPNMYSGLILLAALAWAIYFNLYKKFALDYDPLSMMCYVIWLGTIPLLFYADHVYNAVTHASWQANLSIVLLGLFPSALAHVFWGDVLKKMSLSVASPFLYFTPLVALSLAIIFLGEIPSWWVLLGGGLIMGSIVLMNRTKY